MVLQALKESRGLRLALLFALLVACASQLEFAAPQSQPWMNKSLSPDQRAGLVLKEMTLDEKIGMVTGCFGFHTFRNLQAPKDALGGDGFVLAYRG